MFKITFKNIVYLILYAIPNTIFSFGILYIINNVLSGSTGFLVDYMGIVFIGIVVYTYLLNIVFLKQLNKYSYEILYENEKRIFKRILNTPLITLEKLGSQRFYTVVEDLRVFAWLPETITHTVNSLLMIILCLAYLFMMSTSSALVILGSIVVIAGCYFIVINAMSKKVATLRSYNEDYYQYVNDVMKGFKELKISNSRRGKLRKDYLDPNRENAKGLDFRINYIFLSINLISQYGLYFVIGVILFLLPQIGLLDQALVISYVVVLLFISGPVNNIINLQNIYTRFLVANKRINAFLNDFPSEETEMLPKSAMAKDFESIEFKNISFAYESNNGSTENSFALGPLNLSVKKGEVIFVIGGNGSGKSTFINTLTGLYKTSQGEFILNGQPKESAIEELQNLTAAVFTDNHIFSHNYDDYSIENNSRYRELLKVMKLGKVVEEDTEEAARRKFSKGQSKRMSLIFALLENKPVLVLDEWAADQDPYFRKYFYEELIPRLKQENKTIIAVTHDDAYFNQADRVIKFDYGQIVKDVKVKSDKKLSEALWIE